MIGIQRFFTERLDDIVDDDVFHAAQKLLANAAPALGTFVSYLPSVQG